jgi:ribonuclease-3
MKQTDGLERVARLFGLAPDSERLLEALTHPSFANEVQARHNQRLEFLGDALLGLLSAEYLFERYPRADEGELTRTRAQLVSAPALAEFGRAERIHEALRLGKGQRASLLDSENVVADAVEALLAAAYLDLGIESARAACLRIVEFGLAALAEPAALDPKSDLQARVQALGHRPPVYDEVLREGPAHDMTFEFVVRVADEVIGRGRGRSKRAAEQDAARDALGKLNARGGLESAGGAA